MNAHPWRAALSSLIWLVLCSPAAAQELDATIALKARESFLLRVAPDVQSVQAQATVDTCTRVTVDIYAIVEGVTTTVHGPLGQAIDSTTIANFGGEYFEQYYPERPASPFAWPLPSDGLLQSFSFPSLGPGVYTVTIDASPVFLANPAQGQMPLFVVVTTDSDLQAATFVMSSRLPVGTGQIVCVAALNGAAAAANSSVALTIRGPDGPNVEVVALDDGISADGAAGDGIYSAVFVPDEAGEYLVRGIVTGTTAAGIAYRRVDSCKFSAVTQDARFGAGAITFQGIDDNANTYIDRLVVTAPVEVFIAGDYVLSGLIRTPTGEPLVARGTATFQPGVTTMEASIGAAQVIAHGEAGPYTLVELDLSRSLPEDEYVVDRLLDLDLETDPYTMLEFERPAIELTGTIIDYGVDTDNDGLWNRLVVRIGVRCRVAGNYAFSCDLGDSCGETIVFATGQATFTAGASEQFAQVEFDGDLIGRRGVDGFFEVRNLLMYGASASLIIGHAGQTGSHTAAAFECYVPLWDCNDNGVPDACDLAAGLGTDLNYDGVFDECCPPGSWTRVVGGPE